MRDSINVRDTDETARNSPLARTSAATPRRRLPTGEKAERTTEEKRRPAAVQLYLNTETDGALRERADAEGITLSALGEKAVQQYLSGAAAGQVAEIAAGAIEEAVAQRIDDLLRTLVVQPLRADLAAIHQEVVVARLEGYAHLGNDYGPDHAQQVEAVAMEQATAARKAGTMARLHVLVEEDVNA